MAKSLLPTSTSG